VEGTCGRDARACRGRWEEEQDPCSGWWQSGAAGPNFELRDYGAIVPKRLQVYQADAITVTFDPNLCLHSEECVRGLPEVFNPSQARWIRPDRAPADRVAAAVARCPSGALRVGRPGTAQPATPPAVTVVRVARDGPLYVQGRVRIVSDSGELIAEVDAATLCRCGATANPPFCDGSHERVGR
jgi:uncharacterized Fe-S cluster protein YjdI